MSARESADGIARRAAWREEAAERRRTGHIGHSTAIRAMRQGWVGPGECGSDDAHMAANHRGERRAAEASGSAWR